MSREWTLVLLSRATAPRTPTSSFPTGSTPCPDRSRHDQRSARTYKSTLRSSARAARALEPATAYYLTEMDPTLKVVVLEAETTGFGASGRNGGWCSALFATSVSRLVRTYGTQAEHDLRKELERTVDEVGAVTARKNIDCHFRKGGTLMLARNAGQMERARAEIEQARSLNVGEDDLRLLRAPQVRELVGATHVLGATYTPHCASVHPARLARGLAEVLERRGVHIFEATPVSQISSGRAVTPGGTVRATAIIRATEGYSATFAGLKRKVIPFYSLMIATEPLDAATLDEVGLRNGETFGGRGAPYHYGSQIKPEYDLDPRVHSLLSPSCSRC